MIFRLHKQQHAFRLSIAEPNRYFGQAVGTVEQVQLAAFTAMPGPDDTLAEGELRAVWGLELQDDLNLPLEVIHGLRIGRAFRELFRPKRAFVSQTEQGACLTMPSGAILNTAGSLIHLYPGHAEYTL